MSTSPATAEAAAARLRTFNRLTLLWVVTAFILLLILGLAGLTMRAIQSGLLGGLAFPWFYPILTFHGIGMVALVVLVILFRAIRIVPQATAGVVERLGKYHKTLSPGLNILVPFIDRVRPLIDMREQVVSFPPQPVITEDNLVVNIDSVIYFQVTDAKSATYEIANYIQAIEQLTVTTLRNVVGGMDLEDALTSREEINQQLRMAKDQLSTVEAERDALEHKVAGLNPNHVDPDLLDQQIRSQLDLVSPDEIILMQPSASN
mgnify:CR=1 FL=1